MKMRVEGRLLVLEVRRERDGWAIKLSVKKERAWGPAVKVEKTVDVRVREWREVLLTLLDLKNIAAGFLESILLEEVGVNEYG